MVAQAFNREDWTSRWAGLRRPTFAPLALQLDVFGEFASKPRPVLCVGSQGYAAFRRMWVMKSAETLSGQPSGGELREALAAFDGVRDVWLSLPASQWFEHVVEIPAHGRSEAARIISLEAARSTPFLPEQVISGWYFVENSPTKVAAQNVVVRRDIITPIEQALADAGQRLAGVLVRDEANNHLPLLLRGGVHEFQAAGFARYRKAFVAGAGLSVVAGGLLFVAVSVWSDRQLSLIEARKDALKDDITFVTSELEAAKHQQEGAKALLARRSGVPSPSAILAELTHLLPDDTALSTLSLQGTTLEFEGVSGRPEELIAVIENSPLFANVAFSAPMTNNPSGVSAHFAIRATLERPAGGS